MKKPQLAVILALVYLLITGDGSIGNCLVGLGIGVMVATLCRLTTGRHRKKERQPLKKLMALPLFAWGTGQALAQGSWTMLRILLGQESWKKVGLVEVPIGERSQTGAIISGLIATATPGSVLIEINWRRGIIKLNVINAAAPDETRAQLERFYQKFQKPLLP